MKKCIGFFIFVGMMMGWNPLAAQQKRDADYFKKKLWQAALSQQEKPAQDSAASKESEPEKVCSPLLPTVQKDTIKQFVDIFPTQTLQSWHFEDKDKIRAVLGIPVPASPDGTIVVLPPYTKESVVQVTQKTILYVPPTR